MCADSKSRGEMNSALGSEDYRDRHIRNLFGRERENDLKMFVDDDDGGRSQGNSADTQQVKLHHADIVISSLPTLSIFLFPRFVYE